MMQALTLATVKGAEVPTVAVKEAGNPASPYNDHK